jgi:hypothetical protein
MRDRETFASIRQIGTIWHDSLTLQAPQFPFHLAGHPALIDFVNCGVLVRAAEECATYSSLRILPGERFHRG